MILSHSIETTPAWLGYLAAFVSCLAFGSFAVPIKGRTANRVQIDPLVMQTYKTALCFLTSWIVLFLGETFVLSPWGLLSGLFWVPGGTAGIYAVRTVGIAISQGTWSTLKILVAFVWGMCVFKENVRSRANATLAVLLMITGLWGMSYFAGKALDHEEGGETIGTVVGATNGPEEPLLTSSFVNTEHEQISMGDEDADKSDDRKEGHRSRDNEDSRPEMPDLASHAPIFPHGARLSRRRLGLLCAAVDGVWGGSILVPMHYARRDAKGLGFAISFAIGATLVLWIMWCVRLSYNASAARSWKEAYHKLPSLHFSCMWLPGGTAGLLWSVGNMTSMMSVVSLGELVGFSIVQAQLLVAGLFGVFLYGEIQGSKAILGWFFSAGITLAGVILLGHEHVKSS